MATYLVDTIRAIVTTTDATVTTCGSYTLADETSIWMETRVIGRQSASTNAAGYFVVASVKRESAGGATQVGTSPLLQNAFEDDAAWTATIDVSGNDARVRVTGKAATTVLWTSYTNVWVYTP